MKLMREEYYEPSPHDMWDYVDSSPGPYSYATSDGWKQERANQCLALRSDRRRCEQELKNGAGFCNFHFERLVEFVGGQLGQMVARAARLEDPEAFRFFIDRGRIADAMKVLEEAPSYVYFFAVGDIVKIGRSRNVLGRFTQIRQGSSLRPEGYDMKQAVILGAIPGGAEVEHQLHRMLNTYREVGEWFRLTPTVITAIDHVLYDGPAPKAIEAGLRDMYGQDGGGANRRRNQAGAA